jgi:hypothetical protein
MPAIVRNAALLACLAFASARGDAHSDVIDLFGSLAAALTEVNVPAFMDGFDKDMPGYGDLKNQITALVNQSDVTSSIEPVDEHGDNTHEYLSLY